MAVKNKKKKEVEFCEDVTSFANMEGGVLIIGISNKIPRNVTGIEDLENKMKYTKDVIMKGISYPRELTHFHVLTLEDKFGIDKKFKEANIDIMFNNLVGDKNIVFTGKYDRPCKHTQKSMIIQYCKELE